MHSPLRVGLELLDFGQHQDVVEQVLDAEVGQGAHLDHNRVAAPGLGLQPFLRQLVHDALGVGIGLVDLVDRHHDGHAGGARMADRFLGLRHHAVVGRDHEDDDVGDLGAAGAHSSKRLVARRIQEGDLLVVDRYLVRTGALSNAARLAGGHIRMADAVEQRRLAMVDMTKDCHHGRPLDHVLGVLPLDDLLHLGARLGAFDCAFDGDLRLLFFLGFGRRPLDGHPQLFAEDDGRIVVDRVCDRRHDAVLHQDFDQVDRAALHQRCQVAHGNGSFDGDFLGQRCLDCGRGNAALLVRLGRRPVLRRAVLLRPVLLGATAALATTATTSARVAAARRRLRASARRLRTCGHV